MTGGKASRDKGTVQWRPIPDLPAYEINEFGDVRRLTEAVTRRKGHVVRGHTTSQGYRKYKLATPEGKRQFWAHRLVARAFIGPPPSRDHVIAHRDGNRLNNHYTNLRWATVAENNADTALHGSLKGENNGRARLTMKQVAEARRKYSGRHGEQSSLAREYGMSPSAMRSILIGEHWNG